MKWLETIEFRTIGDRKWSNAMDLESILADLKPEQRPLELKQFNHATVMTDFCLHFCYESEAPAQNGSQLGLTIVAILQRYGMVNHNIWLEV